MATSLQRPASLASGAKRYILMVEDVYNLHAAGGPAGAKAPAIPAGASHRTSPEGPGATKGGRSGHTCQRGDSLELLHVVPATFRLNTGALDESGAVRCYSGPSRDTHYHAINTSFLLLHISHNFLYSAVCTSLELRGLALVAVPSAVTSSLS